ncbi:HNH endonuclease [Microbacterium phage phiMiGM15]
MPKRTLTPAPERFFAKVRPASFEECWHWQGARNVGGYGVFQVGSSRGTARTRLAHVWAYEHLIGTKPEGLDLDHLCRNRACVNPWHLDPVTRGVNVARGALRRDAASGRFFVPEENTP